MSDREKEIRDKWSSKSRQESAIYKFAWDDIAFLLSTIDALRAENEKQKEGDCVHAGSVVTLTTAARCGMCVQDEIITRLTAENEYLKSTQATASYQALELENAKMREAIELRLKSGHNDTCGFSLSKEYSCSCGHDKLAFAGKGKVY